jgi:hypothetical protein
MLAARNSLHDRVSRSAASKIEKDKNDEKEYKMKNDEKNAFQNDLQSTITPAAGVKHTPKRWKKVKCDQCAVLVINNVVCHEFGCPNKKRSR